MSRAEIEALVRAAPNGHALWVATETDGLGPPFARPVPRTQSAIELARAKKHAACEALLVGRRG